MISRFSQQRCVHILHLQGNACPGADDLPSNDRLIGTLGNDNKRHTVIEALMCTVHAAMRNEQSSVGQYFHLRNIMFNDEVSGNFSQLIKLRSRTDRHDDDMLRIPERLEAFLIEGDRLIEHRAER